MCFMLIYVRKMPHFFFIVFTRILRRSFASGGLGNHGTLAVMAEAGAHSPTNEHMSSTSSSDRGGTINRDTTSSDGAALFSGTTGDHIVIPASRSMSLRSSFTAQLWVRRKRVNREEVLIGQRRSPAVIVETQCLLMIA